MQKQQVVWLWVARQLVKAVGMYVALLGKSLLICMLICQISTKEYVRLSDWSTRVMYEVRCAVTYHIELPGFTDIKSLIQQWSTSVWSFLWAYCELLLNGRDSAGATCKTGAAILTTRTMPFWPAMFKVIPRLRSTLEGRLRSRWRQVHKLTASWCMCIGGRWKRGLEGVVICPNQECSGLWSMLWRKSNTLVYHVKGRVWDTRILMYIAAGKFAYRTESWA